MPTQEQVRTALLNGDISPQEALSILVKPMGSINGLPKACSTLNKKPLRIRYVSRGLPFVQIQPQLAVISDFPKGWNLDFGSRSQIKTLRKLTARGHKGSRCARPRGPRNC